MRKPAADSIVGKTESAKAAVAKYEVPEGLPALTEAERTVWNQYTPARNRWKLLIYACCTR